MSCRGATIGALVCLAGCGAERLPGPDDSGEDPVAMIVSSPVILPAGAASHAPGSARITAGTYAYVSLPVGTVPEGITARIENRRSGGIGVAYLSAGGFDPIAVPAQDGDSLLLEVKSLTGAVLLREASAVKHRPPTIVRTSPRPGKRDVPLNASIVVVFSEPIDPATLTQGSFQVKLGTAAVSGSFSLADAGTRAEFTPGQPLATGATYFVALTTAVTGSGGGHLEAFTYEFTSASSTEGLGMSQIVYTGCPGTTPVPGMCGLFVMNADGSGIRQLTEATADNFDSKPAWSPDGARIAFSSYRHCSLTGRLTDLQGGNCGREIYVMYADGSGIARVTRLDDQSARADDPAWQPGGDAIAFTMTLVPIPSGYGISKIGLSDGIVRSLILSTELGFGRGAWSPDGSRLVFSAGSCCTTSDEAAGLRIMNADGSGLVRITTQRDGAPSWSPDGTRIVFQRSPRVANPPNNLFVMAPDGSGEVQLTAEAYPVWSLTPSWSPDGSRIVFKRTSSSTSTTSELWVMNRDGSTPTRIHPGWANLPAWSPFGTVPH
jgi:Tol biopolymer transport system component